MIRPAAAFCAARLGGVPTNNGLRLLWRRRRAEGARALCVKRHILRAAAGLHTIHAKGRRARGTHISQDARRPVKFSERLEDIMEHASSHNALGILFVVTFFASFAAVMIQFG
jgi:hypothetical protein